MSAEFVVIDNGVETEWIDPVEWVKESDEGWRVFNGYCVYDVPVAEGRRVVTREKYGVDQ